MTENDIVLVEVDYEVLVNRYTEIIDFMEQLQEDFPEAKIVCTPKGIDIKVNDNYVRKVKLET